MKNLLTQSALAISLAFGVVVAANFSYADTPRAAVTTEARQLSTFTAVHLSGPYDVVVLAQGTPGVSVTGPKNRLTEVETIVENNTLFVRPVQRNGPLFNFGITRASERVTVHISTAMLHSLKMSGSGDVKLDQVNAQKFTLDVTGPGDLHASGAVGALSLGSHGSGDVDLKRMKMANLDLTMSGPGDVQLADISGDVNITQSGSGDLGVERLHSTSVKAHMTGPGNAQLSGTSRVLHLEMSGSGDVDACALQVQQAANAYLRGPGNGCVAGKISQFDGEVHGSGDLSVKGLEAGTTRLRMQGPGNVRLSGTSAALNAELSGSGELLADQLKVANATIHSRGPGNVALAMVSESLEGDLSGSGDLNASMAGKRLALRMNGPGDAHIQGTVDLVTAQLSGSGNLLGRHLLAGGADVQVRGPGDATLNLLQDAKTAASARVVTIGRDNSRTVAR